MNRQKQYFADNVDAAGNVLPTVGENIRHGVKDIKLPDLSGVSNVRLLVIKIGNNGDVELSEDIDFKVIHEDNAKHVKIIFNSNIACSYPIMLSNTKAFEVWSVYLVNTEKNGGISVRQCPFNTTCVLLIGDKV